MSGEKDLSGLFNRVTALEREDADADSEQSVTRIVKNYSTLGLTVRAIRVNLHQYRICGDANPLYGAVTASDSYL
jgi:hypothetical protein